MDPQEKVEEDYVPPEMKEDVGEVKAGEKQEGKEGAESVRTVEVSISRSSEFSFSHSTLYPVTHFSTIPRF